MSVYDDDSKQTLLQTTETLIANKIDELQLQENVESVAKALTHLHNFWSMITWTTELAQDMRDVAMRTNPELQKRMWDTWIAIQNTHLKYIEYLKARSEFWFGAPDNQNEFDAWVRDLTTEGVEPNPGPKGSNIKAKQVSQPIKIKGKGDYKEVLQSAKKALGPGIKSLINQGTSKLGSLAGSAISKIFGFGDYTVTKNSLMNGAPVFTAKRDERISRRVYIGNVQSSIAFVTQYLISLNPALGQFDPQLRQESWNYEQYEIHGMIFYFRSLSATAIASTNTALGAVIMATSYDSNAAPFDSKLSMENHLFSTSGPPCSDSIHAIECARKQSVLSDLYCRRTDHEKIINRGTPASHALSTASRGSLPAPIEDFHTYDFGDFQLSTAGSQAAADVGELWASYDITLKKHKLLSTPSVMEYMNIGLSGVLSGGINDPFGGSPEDFSGLVTIDNRSTIVPRWVGPDTLNVGRLPPGAYMFIADLNWDTGSVGGSYVQPNIILAPATNDMSGPTRPDHMFYNATLGLRFAPQSAVDGTVTAMAVHSFIITPDVPWSVYPNGLNVKLNYNNGTALPQSLTYGNFILIGFSNVVNP